MALSGLGACRGLQLLPQSANPSEGRLSADGLKIAVRVTKKGFCVGYLAVFHGDTGPEEPQQERCSETSPGPGRQDASPSSAGGFELETLAEFLAEARGRAKAGGGKVEVIIRRDPDAPPGAAQRLQDAMRDRKTPGDPDPFGDLVLTERPEGH